MKKFRGTGVAIITPFKNDSSIDFSSLEKVINHVINGGVNYIVLMGTTGESSTLTKDEKKALISFTLDTINKRVPLVVGIGGNNTQEIITQLKTTALKSVDGILSVAPYYNKPTQKGLYEHFKAIATCSPVPVIMYNIPGRTGCNISAETCLQLAHEFDTIVGVKEASGNMEQIMKIIKGKPENFQVVSGDDLLTLPIIAAGGTGVISVIANAYPAEWSEMVNQCLKSNFKAAREIMFRFTEIIELLFADGNPAGIKAAMNILNLCQNTLRLPLVPVSQQVHARLKKAMESIQ
ncbi:MAG TPA: 4-hydroxy-tetrahydrodipicolinate synthase [Bacteroidales bacterium]|nr:4-hydroxy-tetrahydrodipicolinate synthase [Bacteroidales bacterium]HOK75486.1 4-hydroxy-tetrahydrodipicolinate synthase [Bacteroidales bacterium]HOM39704.1 4-hydroxy-tetrahydrodipicolinate synthase [Bacteroidales bacterium]HOU30303.1 4-hydroxy-tetrahydrodipicolinate synthase [Bacteroidales bacterium]HPP92014.1 4-hydroxy-tetrahydrodipicolinate synthase [Bacteroidales bacterium]